MGLICYFFHIFDVLPCLLNVVHVKSPTALHSTDLFRPTATKGSLGRVSIA